MTSFKITNDDVGVRGIQEGNKTPAITGPVLPVKASNPVQKSPENMLLNLSQPDLKKPEHHLHRRQADRRKTDSPVLLDTRGQHDRRTKIEHSDDPDNDDTLTTQHGIDEMI